MRISTGIGKLLQIEKGDRSMILAVLLQALFTGIFTGSLELVATDLFLESQGAGRFPLAIMISGMVGILIATIYSYFSKQLAIKPFGILNLVAVLVMASVLLAARRILNGPTFDFLLFVVAGPLILITLLGFWTTIRGFLSPSRDRQLSGLIEAVLIGGMILAFTGIPILAGAGFGVALMLYGGMISLVLAACAQLFVLAGSGWSVRGFRKRVKSTGPLLLFSHRFTGLMASFVVLGVCVTVLLHYSFLWVAGNRYTGGVPMVSFLGVFFAIAAFLAWVMKKFLFRWVKRKLGIGFTLLVTPVFLLLLTVASSVAGESFGFGGEPQVFTYFFILVVLSRGVERSLREAMEGPSMHLIYQSLDPRDRHNVKSGIEGVLSQIAVFLIGLFLACVVLISFVEIIHIHYILFGFVVVWFFTGMALFRSYRRMLKVTLESDRIRDNMDISLKDLAHVNLEESPFPMELLQFNPYYFHYTSREDQMLLLGHPNPWVRSYVWDHLLRVSPGLPELTISQMLVHEKEPDVKDRIRRLGKRRLKSRLGLQEAFIRERLDRFSEHNPGAGPALGEAFQSGVNEEVIAALYQVAEEGNTSYLPDVLGLMRDPDEDVKSVAISTAGKLSSSGLGSQLVEFLDHPRLYATAWSSLVAQGTPALEEMENEFHKPGVPLQRQTRIVKAMSAIGGEQAVSLILNKLDYHHRDIFHTVIRCLYENRFRASELQMATVQNAIFRLVRMGTWNLAAKISLRTEDPGGSLALAIDHEIDEVNHTILMLLSMIYERRSVRRIRMNLLDPRGEDRIMAIELLSLLLGEPLRTVLVSYFEDVAVREKIDKLYGLYDVEIFPLEILMKKILNRDGMQLGDFVRICVLERMGSRQELFDEQQILAQGFHPNPKIRETAAQILRRIDPGRYDLVTGRLDFPDNSFPGHEDPAGWYMEVTTRLTAWELFANVGINVLFKLVSALRPLPGTSVPVDDAVVLARSVEPGVISSLSKGIALIAGYHPEILEQIRYLASGGKCEAYLIERELFIELLFDERSLLHGFCSSLDQSRPLLA